MASSVAFAGPTYYLQHYSGYYNDLTFVLAKEDRIVLVLTYGDSDNPTWRISVGEERAPVSMLEWAKTLIFLNPSVETALQAGRSYVALT